MSGALLRSGSLKDFQALGAVGNPVYSAASQLRSALRRQLGPAVADLFAIPKQNERGDSIDWYSPIEGDVVPWSAASGEERSAAKRALLASRERLIERSQILQAADDSERQVFGKLLEQAVQVPSQEHVYLVHGKPVITFWGFTERDAHFGTDVLGALPTGAGPAQTPPVPTESPAAVAEEPRAWPWYWWLLLALLLAALLLFSLRSCWKDAPRDATPPDVALEPEAETIPEPIMTEQIRRELDQVPDNVRRRPGRDLEVQRDLVLDRAARTFTTSTDIEEQAVGAEEASSAIATDGSSMESELPPDSAGLADVLDDPAAVHEDEVPPPADESGVSPEIPPEPEAAAQDRATEDVEKAPELPPGFQSGELPQGPQSGELPPGSPLQVPPEAAEAGSTEFLNGNWRSLTGLQDSEGNPVQLQYDFSKGAGTATLLRGSGPAEQKCTGPVQSTMSDGKLVIKETRNITCPDGTVFRRSNVECSIGEHGQADCRGLNEDGTSYGVSISSP